MMPVGSRGALRGAIGKVLAAPPTYGLIKVPAEARNVRREAGAIEKAFGEGGGARPPEEDLRTRWNRIRAAWARRDLGSVSQLDWRYSPWILYFPPRDESQWLALDHHFLEAYRAILRQKGSALLTRALLNEFLRAARPEDSTYETFRALLRARIDDRKKTLLRPLRERCSRYGFLERQNHVALAKVWLSEATPVDDFLKTAGLSPGLESSRLVERTVLALLWKLNSDLRSGDDGAAQLLVRILPWLKAKNHRLRFETLRLQTAEALLSPFIDQAPDPKIAQELRTFFLHWFGDPRVGARSSWAGVPDDQRRVLLRLLVELALEDFFRLLDRTALDRLWAPRKAFWKEYLKADVITDAWIVLGPQAARQARTHLGAEMAQSAAVLKSPPDGAHSVLLMRVGQLTVAEWSHNASCRFWTDDNPKKPRLYQPSYESKKLQKLGSPNEELHHRGSWPQRFEDYIRAETRIGMPYARIVLLRSR